MPTRAQIIRKATDNARKSWEAYTREQEWAIYEVFKQAADRLEAAIAKFAGMDKPIPTRLLLLQQNIAEEMADLRPRLKGLIITGMRNSVDYGVKQGVYSMAAVLTGGKFKATVGTAYIGKDGLVRRYAAADELYAYSGWAKINGAAMDAVMRWNPGGITLSDRVWDITWAAEKAIRQRVASALVLGESPAKTGRTIRQYLVQPKGLRKYPEIAPGPGVYRSAVKNALRLTRTEMARAASEGTIRYAMEKKWIDGFIWRVGGGEPCEVCQDLDGQFFGKDAAPQLPAHPHCMCYLELHIADDAMAKMGPMAAALPAPLKWLVA